ncbi:repressor LexA [Clostridium butyricum]|uniref:Repressor LexA n=1 Tax=Clostridium butyricum TaxID=1492 RepID=A0A6L9EPM9_CLOBU|nr:repressor LexA [Clostridium butyricum]
MGNNKQREIYEFLKEYTENCGYPPTVREICEAVSLKSTSTVQGHLERLQNKGLIKRNPLKPRALEITELSIPKREMIGIPIIREYKENIDLLDKTNVQDIFRLPIDFVKHDGELFMIKVADNSMMDTGINKNDLAIMEKTNTINNGEIALIFVNQNTIIRRCFFENNSIRLQSENNEFKDLELSQCKILGRLIGIYRAL